MVFHIGNVAAKSWSGPCGQEIRAGGRVGIDIPAVARTVRRQRDLVARRLARHARRQSAGGNVHIGEGRGRNTVAFPELLDGEHRSMSLVRKRAATNDDAIIAQGNKRAVRLGNNFKKITSDLKHMPILSSIA